MKGGGDLILNYANLDFDMDGNPETPELLLQTMAGDTIGVIPGVYNIHLHIKFSEPSELTFDVPSVIDGVDNWIYDRIDGYKLIYTKRYGVYLILNPRTESDGAKEFKRVECYSIEKTLDYKKFFIEEGTYKFYNRVSPGDPDTIIGRVLEIVPDWKIGEIPEEIAQRYRTFDEYDDYLLSFLYNDAAQKFRCVFVFDSYHKTIHCYSADESREILPIYLDFDNLIKNITVDEISDEIKTALRPYGADGLDIRDVNPIGTNWLYDLSYFIQNGDISEELAEKWNRWRRQIAANQGIYKALTSLYASAATKLLNEKAKLSELNSQKSLIILQQNATIQALSLELSDAGLANRNAEMGENKARMDNILNKIAAQEKAVAMIELDMAVTKGRLEAITRNLAFNTTPLFTESDRAVFRSYFIEDDLTETSFVATTVKANTDGGIREFENAAFALKSSEITEIDALDDTESVLYTIVGGSFSCGDLTANIPEFSGDIIRGDLELNSDGNFSLSFYAGNIRLPNINYASGTVILIGAHDGFSGDIHAIYKNGVKYKTGSELRFNILSCSAYLTTDLSDYQRVSVQTELYEFAAKELAQKAFPTYEFSIDSSNFIFAHDFAPFRNKLELGKGVYLNLGHGQVITPYIIEFEIDFERRGELSLVFSNRFKRHNYTHTLSDMLERTYSSGRSFEAGRHIYGETSEQAAGVSLFMNSALNAAKNRIIGASDESVVIDGAGIQISGGKNNSDTSGCEMRIVRDMIALTDDNWETAKMAMGLFATPDGGTYFGVNADVIAGKLLIGNHMILENPQTDGLGNQTGVMQFKVDAGGAWMNNGVFILQNDFGGKIILHPAYGIVAGNENLYTVNGANITPGFITEFGALDLDSEDMPRNANFFLDIRNGNAYFRGTVHANAGNIGGFIIEGEQLSAGSGNNFGALNGSADSPYFIWSGGSNPANAPFWVKKNGDLYARNGTFSGVLNGRLNGGGLVLDGTLSGRDSNSGENARGVIDADSIELKSGYGRLCCARGMDAGGNTTYGAKIEGSDPDFYIIATNAGVRLQAPEDNPEEGDASGKYLTVTPRGVFTKEDIITGSDSRIKKDVSYDMSKYEQFFLNLKPAYYRMRSGDSNRFHTGFIAQDVEEALKIAGLDSADFAGFVRTNGHGDTPGRYKDQRYLRYADFISLNTHMIQKLNARVDELEKLNARVNELEKLNARVDELERKLAELENSRGDYAT